MQLSSDSPAACADMASGVLQPAEVNDGADAPLFPVRDPTAEQGATSARRPAPKEGRDSRRSSHGSSLSLGGLHPRTDPTLEQFVKKCSPITKTHSGEGQGGLCPGGGTPLCSRERPPGALLLGGEEQQRQREMNRLQSPSSSTCAAWSREAAKLGAELSPAGRGGWGKGVFKS